MIPLKNTYIEDIGIEVEGIIKDFFLYEEVNPTSNLTNHSEIVEIHKILDKILPEAIDEIFHQELSKILHVKKEIKSLTEQIEIKDKEISQEIKFFMPILQKLDSNLNEINAEEEDILRDPFQRSILELAISKKSRSKLLKNEKNDVKTDNGRSFFKQRPRSANILFMEKRISEIYNNGEISKDMLKNHLKTLLNEWKELTPETKKQYEEEAENELLLYIQ